MSDSHVKKISHYHQASSTLPKVWLSYFPCFIFSNSAVTSVQLLHKRPKTRREKKSLACMPTVRLQEGAKLFKVAALWMWKITSRDEKPFSLTGPPCTFRPRVFDVCSRCACAHVREILGITEAFPLLQLSHSEAIKAGPQKHTQGRLLRRTAPFVLCLLCAALSAPLSPRSLTLRLTSAARLFHPLLVSS